MKLPFPFKNLEGRKAPGKIHTWQWPSCKHPKTLSFRASDEVIKTVNSIYLDQSDEVETPETWFTTSSEAPSHSTRSESFLDGEESCEAILQELLLSERLFFDPDETRSIVKQEKSQLLPFEDSVALALESKDPYVDFRRSMEEMVESHGIKEWECLEELLGWYLKVNGKKNHGFIVGAFVDLLVGMVPSSSSTTTITTTTTTTTTTKNVSISDSDSFASCFSSPISPLLEKESIHEEDIIVIS